jgi:predicted RNase H-like HicB family nuclease
MIQDLEGCISEGDTLEEAMENILSAKQAWLETAWKYGDEIPLPSNFIADN